MGAPTITGTAQVGQTLDGGHHRHHGFGRADQRHLRRTSGSGFGRHSDEEDISGENSSTYTLVDADLGKTIKVKVSFTDDASNSETTHQRSATVDGGSRHHPAGRWRA